MKRLIGICFLAAAAAVAAAAFTDRPWGAAQAQQAGDASRTIPSLADIMSATQWRHLKLAYSGKVSNWPLANYELGQIQQSFSAAAELYPTLQGVPLARLIKDESGPPLADIGKAIERIGRDSHGGYLTLLRLPPSASPVAAPRK